MVEHDAPWERDALGGSRFPAPVRERLERLDGVRVQLVRRPGRGGGAGTTVLAATVGADGAVAVGSTTLDDPADLLAPGPDAALDALAAGRQPLPTHDDPLWLVCTNGRRDVCCAKTGRPVAAALAERWPAATWETTHLGGHRFAGTLLAWPAGLCLGRLDAATAADACAAIESGGAPDPALVRGRAGLPVAVQAAVQAVVERTGDAGARPLPADPAAPGDPAAPADPADAGLVSVLAAGRRWRVQVAVEPGEPGLLSCGDAAPRPTTRCRAVVVGDRPA